jgi:hypothetical protein
MREIDKGSSMLYQGWSGVWGEIGKAERRAEHSTKRSEVECEDRSGAFPISSRQGVVVMRLWDSEWMLDRLGPG